MRAVILTAVCLVVFKFALLPARVRGISMLPTYQDGSINFINRLAYLAHGPRRGDVVGIRLGRSSGSLHTPAIMYLKRIVGLPGENVSFAGGHLYVNGTQMDEPYVKNPCDWNAAPVADGPRQYYVVGDNRSMPEEDHEHGRAERDQIVGKALF